MTLIGAAVGISAFVSLTSVGNEFKTQLGDIVKTYNIDITVTSKGSATPVASTISMSDYRGFLKIENVRNASSLIVGPVTSPWNRYFLLFGVSSVETFLNKIGMVEGRVITPGMKEVMIGERAAADHRLKVKDRILLADQEQFTITGIYASGSRIIDGAAMVDIRDAQALLKRYDSINMAFLQTTVGSDPGDVARDICRRLQNVSAVTSGEFVGQIRLFKTMDVFVWGISLISFVTCCIIVMNTFLMAVSERTKEIGLLMAVGWSRLRVMKMIVCESLMVCLLGGLLGNLMAFIELWLFHVMNPEGLGWLVSMSFSMKIFWESIALSLLLGTAGSLYPAIRASRLLPAEALRYE